jgi:hypothetical protein
MKAFENVLTNWLNMKVKSIELISNDKIKEWVDNLEETGLQDSDAYKILIKELRNRKLKSILD